MYNNNYGKDQGRKQSNNPPNDPRKNYKGNHQNPETLINEKFKELNYQERWIKEGADKDLIDFAEKAGKYMAKKLSKSKIRSIYGEIKRIQIGKYENHKNSFYLLRPKVAYALGRDKENEGLRLFKKIFDEGSRSVSDEKTFQNFCDLFEAILAYHKAYGGKD
ncbi:MAG: type III-A CRISPR-associated protein Csm2 [Bacteroides sp.]|nr:type III-A CRISPR-associated protein Csm2 [Bacteroides sp.]